MKLPELHPELWIHIFGFLKRDVSPLWIPATWSEFHQEDLASVRGVSVLIHNIAAPLLYHSVVTCSLPILLNGLDATEQPRLDTLSARIQTKDELVAKTKSLRIVGLGPSITPVTNFAHVLESGDWRKIGISRKQTAQRVRGSAMDELAELGRRKALFVAIQPIFHKLEKITLGQVYNLPCAWDFVDPSEEVMQFAQANFDSFLGALEPMYVCLNTCEGPYCVRSLLYYPKGSPAETKTKPTPIVTRHLYEGVYNRSPSFAFGATNRWIALPASILESRRGPEHKWDEENEEAESDFLSSIRQAIEYYAGIETIVMNEQWKKLGSKTVLDIYGHSMGEHPQEYLLCQTTTEQNAGRVTEDTYPGQTERQDEIIATAFQARAHLRWKENQLSTTLTAKLQADPTIPRGWKGTVRFKRWRDTPTCCCCGWDLETGRQIGAERLIRRSGIPEIQGMAFILASPIVNASRERTPIRFPWDPDASLHRKLLAEKAEARGGRR